MINWLFWSVGQFYDVCNRIDGVGSKPHEHVAGKGKFFSINTIGIRVDGGLYHEKPLPSVLGTPELASIAYEDVI